MWSAIGLALLFALGMRKHIDISVAKDRNPPFMLMSDGEVRNAYTVKLRNMESRPRRDGDRPARAGRRGDVERRHAALRRRAHPAPHGRRRPGRAGAGLCHRPRGTAAQEFGFTLRALDQEGGSDAHQARFDAPGGTSE